MSYFFRTNDFELDKYDIEIECQPKFTKSERELFNYLLEISKWGEEYTEIDLISLRERFDDSRRLAFKLSKKLITCYIKNKNNKRSEISFSIFDFIIFEDHKFIFNFSNEIKKSKNFGNFYSRINIIGILQFKLLYTKKIFKIFLKHHEKKGVIYYSLDKLKKLLDIDLENYSRFYNLENKVLNPIVKDLENAGITLWFEKVKNSPAKTSRVTGVKIHYVNQPISRIHNDTNEIIKKYRDEIKDFAKAYELIYNFKKFNTYDDTIDYVEKNKVDIFD